MVGFNGNGDRATDGRFLPGHSKPGPGNPHQAQINKFRASLFAEIEKVGYGRVARKLIKMACSGNMEAIREINLRVFGRPTESAPMIEQATPDGPRKVVILDYRERPTN